MIEVWNSANTAAANEALCRLRKTSDCDRELPPVNQARRSRMILQYYLWCLPLWWVLGVDLVSVQLLALILVCVAPDAHRLFGGSDYVLVGIMVVLGTSAYLNGFLFTQDIVRAIGAVYNLSFWFCGLVIIQQVRYVTSQGAYEREALLAAGSQAFMIFAVLAAGAFGYAYATGQPGISMRTALGMVLNGSGIPAIDASTAADFTQPDWGGTDLPRVHIYSPYVPPTGAIAVSLGAMALLYRFARNQVKSWQVLLIECCTLAAVAATFARSIIAGWLMGYFFASFIFGSAARRITSAGIALGAAIMLYGASSVLPDLSEYRVDSSTSRLQIYERSAMDALRSSAFIGIGIKPRERGRREPIGSHSTYISSLTRGGVVTLALVVTYFLFIPAYWWGIVIGRHLISMHESSMLQAECRVLLHFYIAISVWLFFEDIDAPATASMLIFFCFALMQGTLWRVRAKTLREFQRDRY